jgi:hypothetical protein
MKFVDLPSPHPSPQRGEGRVRRPIKGVSKLTVKQNCSIFNNLKGLDYKGLSPFYILE